MTASTEQQLSVTLMMCCPLLFLELPSNSGHVLEITPLIEHFERCLPLLVCVRSALLFFIIHMINLIGNCDEHNTVYG